VHINVCNMCMSGDLREAILGSSLDDELISDLRTALVTDFGGGCGGAKEDELEAVRSSAICFHRYLLVG
jgi:hypothetical protein